MPERLTLREKLIEADKTTRELVQHLEQAFIPKVHNLRRLSRSGMDPERDEVKDISIRNSADDALQSDAYARKLCGQLSEFLQAIDKDVTHVFENG